MSHVSVLSEEVVEYFEPRYENFLDLTFGLGGHSRLILEKYPHVNAVGVDYDAQMLAKGAALLSEDSKNRTRLISGNFSQVIADLLQTDFKADFVIMDLGINSAQLDDPERGFTFLKDGPLDMRMDKNQDIHAEFILNNYAEQDLREIFFTYGEERYSKSISGKIIKTREAKPIKSTLELVDIIKSAVPKTYRTGPIHCATRVFQALRIAVNKEIDSLENALSLLPKLINSKGRLAAISFHSLEDRLIKNAMRLWAKSCVCEPDAPICICNHQAIAIQLNKKPITAKTTEVMTNPRARSAKLRIAEFL